MRNLFVLQIKRTSPVIITNKDGSLMTQTQCSVKKRSLSFRGGVVFITFDTRWFIKPKENEKYFIPERNYNVVVFFLNKNTPIIFN